MIHITKFYFYILIHNFKFTLNKKNLPKGEKWPRSIVPHPLAQVQRVTLKYGPHVKHMKVNIIIRFVDKINDKKKNNNRKYQQEHQDQQKVLPQFTIVAIGPLEFIRV